MKGLKKLLTGILAGALSLTMTFGSAVVANAEETTPAGNGTITFDNAIKGQEYTIYRVFDFVSSGQTDENGEATNGVYSLSDKWSGFTSSYFTVVDGVINTKDADGNNKLATEDDAKAFAAEALAYAKANHIVNDGSQTTAAATETERQAGQFTTTVTFSNLPWGYYLLDSTTGVLCSLDTVKPNATIHEKNGIPTVDKTMEENSNPGAYDKTVYTDLTTGNDVEIGQTVKYETVAHLKANGTDYVVVDTMTDGLTLDQDSVKEENITYSVAGATSVKESGITKTAHGFSIAFTDPTADVDVTIHYTATLNASAEVSKVVDDSAAGANKNEAYVKYGKGSETTHKFTETKTYELQILKYRAEDEANKAQLADAHFTLTNVRTNELLKFTVSGDKNEVYTVTKEDGEGVTSDIVTVEGTNIVIRGLDRDAYYLTETQAPAGRNLISDYVEKDGSKLEHTKLVQVGTTVTTILVPNNTGSLLPSTGGIGTTIFYILGGILIVAGVAYFIVRRKANAE